MHQDHLIFTLTGGLAAALVLGYLAHLLRLSPILGYLAAGIVVGPHTPGFNADPETADQFAEVGVILLMFGVGLQFHIEELLAVRKTAIPGAILQCLLSTLMGTVVGRAFGWGFEAAIVFGVSLSMASTVVMIRSLTDSHEMHTRLGRLAMGWLVIQDIIAVLVLVLLPQMVGQKEFDPANFALLFLMTLVKVAILVAGVFLLGSWFIPTVLFNIAKTRSRELFTLTVLVLALGIAVVSAQIFGVSMALGAFLAGMVVGRSEFSIRAANEALPMRDAFAVLFFVSIGMMLDPVAIWFKPFLPLCALGVVMIGTPLVSMVLLLLLGRRPRPAAILALSLGQIGEFSFIIVLMGREMEVLSQDAVQAVVAASLFSISLNPLIKRFAKPLEKLLVGLGWERKTALTNDGTATEISDPLPRAIIIGFGPVGRILCRLLEENKIVPTIIELNMETVMRLRAQGIFAIYGDASHPDTLKSAGVADADALILSTSSLPGAKEVIRIARERNPKIGVLARASYLREQKDLLDCGADQAFSGEGEVALAMTEAVLARLGATPEQIDRERERVREELFGTPKTEMSVGGQV